MTSYVTSELLYAISRLEEKYPDAFKAKTGFENDIVEVIPADDPDLRTVVRFRNGVKAGDCRKRENKYLAKRIADCFNKYMTMETTASYLEMDLVDVKFMAEHDANLRNLYRKRQHDWERIVVYDKRTNDYKTYPDEYAAAAGIGLKRPSGLEYYIKRRHYPYLINKRYKAKRKVWFDEDNGM